MVQVSYWDIQKYRIPFQNSYQSVCKFLLKLLNYLLLILPQYGHSPITEESQLNGCYVSHIILHSGTHVAKIPDHVEDEIASPVNCALATMVNAVSGLDGKNPHRNTVAVIQVN